MLVLKCETYRITQQWVASCSSKYTDSVSHLGLSWKSQHSTIKVQKKSRASPSPANRNLPKATESSHNASGRPWGWKAKEICQETGERQRERFKSSTFIQHIYEYSWGTGRQVHLPPIKQIHSYIEQDLWHIPETFSRIMSVVSRWD